MECSRTNVGQLPLDQFVRVVSTIYNGHDQYRSIWDVWCHTMHHAAGIAEQIRKGESEEDLYREIADFSLWLFTMVLKLSGEFGHPKGEFEGPQDRYIRIWNSCSDIVWHKYPKLCPLCHDKRIARANVAEVKLGDIQPCCCPPNPGTQESDDAWRRRIAAVREYSGQIYAEKPKGIDEWQGMFGAVFGDKLSLFSLSDISLHLMEELGETSDAMIRMYSYSPNTFVDGEPNRRQVKLEAQFADVFSWLFALVEKLNFLKQPVLGSGTADQEMIPQPTRAIRLSEIIWQRYGSDSRQLFCCWKCKLPDCGCKIILVPNVRPSAELLEKYHHPEP
jgi:hypothetical protein